MYKLPSIDFSKAKFLSAETIEFHYGKHHKAYVDNLNKLIEGKENKDLTHLIKTEKGPLFNNAAQTFNHTFYWFCLTPESKSSNPSSALAQKIVSQYGSLDALKTAYVASATSVFGSGWTWLALNKSNSNLEIINTGNAELVNLDQFMPLMVVDVWEHAYYIQYRNGRATYLSDFWNAINWSFVEENFNSKSLDKTLKSMI